MPKAINITNQVKTLEENWKRALADYQNLVKRVEADKKDFLRFSNVNLIAKFIPALDILELAAAHSQDPGIQMAVKQFRDILNDEGLQIISPNIGDAFDHRYHECTEVVIGEPDNTIAETVQKGYKIDDYVIRPAKVKVFKKEHV